MILSKEGGGEVALGIINTDTAIAMLVGSITACIMPDPKSRVRVICNELLLVLQKLILKI